MEAIETAEVGELRVVVVYDDHSYASNPRDNDNMARIYGNHSRYTIGDGEMPYDHERALERGGMKLLTRYLRMCEGAVTVRGVGMYEHSGVSYYTFEPGGDDRSPGGQHRDWDSGQVGYAYIPAKRWVEMQGADTALPTAEEAQRIIDAEVKEYGQWANGEVYGYRVMAPCRDDHHDDDRDEAFECDHAEELDSCYGFIGESEYAMSEGKASAESFVASREAAE